MKYFTLFFCYVILTNSQAQTLNIPKYSISVKTDLDSISIAQISNLIENDVESIKLVSLKPVCEKYTKWVDSVSLDVEEVRYSFESLIDLNKKVIDTTRFKTIVNIKNEDVSKLISTIYQSKSEFEVGQCYQPRHGVVFYNYENKIIGLIEICFECSQIHVFGKVPFPGQMAYKDYMRIKQIFATYMNDYINK